KYYPPDFDPSKIPKLKLPKDRQYVVRLMAPFNMRCKTCGEYIYKGKKFNARKETVQNELYLGLPIFRFYIKCTRCLAEITFKTDPENTDYAMEHGATRNFQAEKLIEEEEKKIQREREEEELNNPMKVLENRTRDSKMEMEVLENLQELKELNQRQAQVDFEGMLGRYKEEEEREKERQKEEDERETWEILEKALATNSLQGGVKHSHVETWERSVGGLNGGPLGQLVVRKKPGSSAPKSETATQLTAKSAQSKMDPKPTTSPANNTQPVAMQSVSSLSLLGAYSDTDDSE
ncbi:coiled-coil domain-containing protein 94-like, partial [Scleropages formosus]